MLNLKILVSPWVYGKRDEFHLKDYYSADVYKKTISRLERLPEASAIGQLKHQKIKTIGLMSEEIKERQSQALLIPIIEEGRFKILLDSRCSISFWVFAIGHELSHTFEYASRIVNGKRKMFNVLYPNGYSESPNKDKAHELREDVCNLFSAMWISETNIRKTIIKSISPLKA